MSPLYCPNPDCPDREATGVPGEYTELVSSCPYCGAHLVSSLDGADLPAPPEETDIDGHGDELVPVLETSDPAELEIAKSILHGAEIPFHVQGEERYNAFRGGRAAFRFNPRGGAVVVVVAEENAEEARILLTEVEPGLHETD